MRDLKQIAVAPLSGGACRHLKLVAVAKEAEQRAGRALELFSPLFQGPALGVINARTSLARCAPAL